jgi:hypothetical protein
MGMKTILLLAGKFDSLEPQLTNKPTTANIFCNIRKKSKHSLTLK